ncbi:MAG: acetylornithine transaminase [Actinomycetaceae bacterium]|nr:acetylornithine transaminase [Actinomycetaceae bacterium]
MTENTWTQRYHDSLMNTFGTPSLLLKSGQGAYVWDSEGKKYIDLLGGIAVNVLGHAHPAIIAAVATQVGKLAHISNFFASAPQIRLGERILEILGSDGRVFLTNSGTEANECALKMIRAYGNAQEKPRHRILALEHSFHGRSTGALALTWKEAYREPFAPLIPGVEFIPAGDIEALEKAIGTDVAGIIIEPIQGEAGVRPLDVEYMRQVRDIATKNGALLAVDEVQTGIGRTGKWMGHHWADIRPDIVTLAKGLGAGMPIGACIGLGENGHLLAPGMHGSTFGGNPVCAAAALATLEVIESENLITRAEEVGNSFRQAVQASGADYLVDIRGQGLLIGIEFSLNIAPALVTIARDNGWIINATNETTLRLAPPLIIDESDLNEFAQRLPEFVTAAVEMTQQGSHS